MPAFQVTGALEQRGPGRPPIYEFPMKIHSVRFTDKQWGDLRELAKENCTTRAGLIRMWLRIAK